jgi:hypothetical protein
LPPPKPPPKRRRPQKPPPRKRGLLRRVPRRQQRLRQRRQSLSQCPRPAFCGRACLQRGRQQRHRLPLRLRLIRPHIQERIQQRA